MYSSCLAAGVLFLWSPILIILYYACSLLDITYYLATCSCIHVLMTRFSIYAYDRFIDTHVLTYAHHLTYVTHSLGSSDSLDPLMSRS